MKKILKKRILCSLFILMALFSMSSFAQEARIDSLQKNLEQLLTDLPELNEKVELSVSNVSIRELVRGIANANNLNISVSPNLNTIVANNFSDVRVMDVLLFLCRQYDLDIRITGSILSIEKYVEEEEVVLKELKIEYDSNSKTLSMDLKNDLLEDVLKEIVRKSGKQITPKGLKQKLVTVYVKKLPFEDALEQLAYANDLKIINNRKDVYLIEEQELKTVNANGGKNSTRRRKSFQLKVNDANDISIVADKVPIADVILEVADKLKLNYFVYSEMKETTSLNVQHYSFTQLVEHLFNTTDYTLRKEGNIYMLGQRKEEGIRDTRLLSLQHRSVDLILDYVPADLKNLIEIKEFPELNSLVISGSIPNMDELEKFVKDIDKPVPVVMIEVMIVDYQDTEGLSIGVDAGIGTEPTQTQGKVFPGWDYTMGANSVNNLIRSFDGFGSLNLGKVTPNFYLNISALEENGIIDVRSTPKLAAMNGHEASLRIGTTEFYVVETSNTIGTQNPQIQRVRNFQSVQADLNITIKPMVAADKSVTLDIKVSQSDFTGRISPDAPPGQVTREFSSLIRVDDGEMILLGGLEEAAKNDTGSGVPFLARIPVIKWFFSKRVRTKKDAKLNIFIKASVIS